MVKLFIIAEGTKINIELDSVDITSEEFKKLIEKNMNPDKVIPHDKQSVFINKEKLADDKKLSDYISSETKEVKVFVLRKSKNILSSGSKSQESQPKKTDSATYNPYNQQQAPRNPYEGVQNMQLPNWGYPSPSQSYGQPPAFGYGSPGQGFSQMPGNNLISKEQIELLLNNPQFLDQIIDLQAPGLSPEEKESRKKMYHDCFQMLKNDPSLMNSLNSMAPDLLRGGMNFPPQQQQPPSPYGYPPQYGMPPQQNVNPYYQPPPYYGYPPYGAMPPYGMPSQQPPMSPSHYEAAYSLQLKALEEMGFNNKKDNLDALIKTNGDINAALDYLRKDENFKRD